MKLSDLKCWVNNDSLVCKMHDVRRYLSLRSPTAEFVQRNASVWLSLKGKIQNKYIKNRPLTKLQSCKSQDLLQDLIYSVVQHSQKYSRYFSDTDKGNNNS